MIQGMTGFASKLITLTSDNEKAQASLQLKTLNSRYFEANIKLPSALSFLEIDLTKLFKEKLLRGYVYFTLYIDNPSLFKGNINPAINVVKEYIAAIETIKKECALYDTVTLPMILELPNIFSVSEKEIDEHHVKRIMATINELIQIVVSEREKEGQFIKKDLLQRFGVMKDDIEYIEKRSQEVIEEQKQKVTDIIDELNGDESELAEARKNAVFAVLDKIDIHEEIVRFKNHMHQLQQILETPKIEKGKRVDFTLQEMAREINTVAAKCSDSEISSRAIDIKVELEKAREQAQNTV